MKSRKEAATFRLLGLSQGASCRYVTLGGCSQIWGVTQTSCSRLVVLSSCHPSSPHLPPHPDWQPSFCLLSHLRQNRRINARPSLPLPGPLRSTATAIRSKLEEERIKMGNLPVIPRTAAKRAICLINSLVCRSAAWLSSIFPSARPPMHPWRAREGEVKEET